jgi:hypothetical protein
LIPKLCTSEPVTQPSIYMSGNVKGNFKGQVLCKVEYKQLANCSA